MREGGGMKGKEVLIDSYSIRDIFDIIKVIIVRKSKEFYNGYFLRNENIREKKFKLSYFWNQKVIYVIRGNLFWIFFRGLGFKKLDNLEI